MKKITIGAGIVGIATAAYLRRDGHEVTVIDRLPPGDDTSFGNAEYCRRDRACQLRCPASCRKSPGI